jgi:hypothetical protein
MAVRPSSPGSAYAKGVYYEWVRTLAVARQFQEEHPDLVTPPGFDL